MDSVPVSDSPAFAPPRNALGHPITGIVTSLLPTSTISGIRRKPIVTYRSPSAHIPSELRVEASVSRALLLELASSAGSASSWSSKPASTTKADTIFIRSATTTTATDESKTTLEKKEGVQKKKYPMGPPLPLYHPRGKLALSLPELDPSAFGLPAAGGGRADDGGRRASARARRPAAKLRDADGEGEERVGFGEVSESGGGGGGGGVDRIDEVLHVGVTGPGVVPPTRDVRERTGTRKRRNGGGGRRKRKEADDGDGTYPAKRPRNSARGMVAVREGSAGVESAVAEDTVNVVGEVAVEEKKPERRLTRSRGVPRKRRESSASETTATSGSAPASASGVDGKGDNGNVVVDTVEGGSRIKAQ